MCNTYAAWTCREQTYCADTDPSIQLQVSVMPASVQQSLVSYPLIKLPMHNAANLSVSNDVTWPDVGTKTLSGSMWLWRQLFTIPQQASQASMMHAGCSRACSWRTGRSSAP